MSSLPKCHQFPAGGRPKAQVDCDLSFSHRNEVSDLFDDIALLFKGKVGPMTVEILGLSDHLV
jgi:hypothetical protein